MIPARTALTPADTGPTEHALLAQPGRDEGQQWARDELSDPVYREADMTLFERIGRAISDFFSDMVDSAAGIESPALTIVVIVAVIALIVLAVWWARRGADVRLEHVAARQPVFRAQLDPVALRRTAAEAAAAEDWRLAVQDLVRAVFAEQANAQRIVIDRASTAQELAAASSAALPRSADDFSQLAVLFDDVSFSGHRVTRDAWERAGALDARITTGGPAPAGSVGLVAGIGSAAGDGSGAGDGRTTGTSGGGA
ncbi:DUF4129 domain-containing protein [Brevibacterium jeotgali]|uniref:Protein-glutamine gamma-glutamyltransferase-like C-terminal domain-containing protein n=1 Tax=Brevibacterium jeotgali TaxID=1262550 RepID=A0A2H1L7P0_9MICO|nr:DUF4129 domain-containing protein [Brevibacterium jeotgali]TWC03560.1 uncharacterized protein DUF4129 [Brevibacterium jeotgali]SMY12383.1 protein of unknown function (DUF4129) [Brevibacterium jeotgali]